LPDDHEHREVEPSMDSGAEPSTNDIVDLLVGRPGWRLEPRSTPGTTPQWCFVSNGKIEYSVTVTDGSLLLYVMETDQEIIFKSADGLLAWLRANRSEAALPPEAPRTKTSRLRKITQWG
jgi:hypothetical protein